MNEPKKEKPQAVDAIRKAELTLEREEAALKALRKESETLRDEPGPDKVAAAKRIAEIGEGRNIKEATGLILVKLAEIDKAREDLEKAHQEKRDAAAGKYAEIFKSWLPRINAQLREEAKFRRELYGIVLDAKRDGAKPMRYLRIHSQLARHGFDLFGYIGRLPVVYGEGQEEKERWYFDIDTEEQRVNVERRAAMLKAKGKGNA